MDIVFGPIIMVIVLFYIICFIFWIIARSDQKRVNRIWKMGSVFLFWFIINWLFIMNLLMTPVWYEPSPAIPGNFALSYFPIFIMLSIPFIIDLLNQLDKPDRERSFL